MDATILANIDQVSKSGFDDGTVGEFIEHQRTLVENVYRNDNSYLAAGQQASDSYMEMKQRIPMVIEYYVSPDELYTVEMYINPDKLDFKYAKIIGESITRNGAFFHHHGEKPVELTLSGNTGMSGMAGIAQLEKIFNYSGTLLRYKNVGLTKIDNGTSNQRKMLSLQEVMATFDSLTYDENKLDHLGETYGTIKDQVTIILDNNTELLSETKAMELITSDMSLFNTNVKYTEWNFSLKEIVVKVNEAFYGAHPSFSDIYYKTLDFIQQYSANGMFYSAGISDKENTQNTNDPQLKNLIDTPDEIRIAAFQVAYDIYKSAFDNYQKNKEETEELEELIEFEVGRYEQYECLEPFELRKEPTTQSTGLDITLKKGGIFTAKARCGNWVEHMNGGWAKIYDDPKDNEYIVTRLGVWLYEKPGSWDDNNRFQEGTALLYPNGWFTSISSKTIDNVEWLQHKISKAWVSKTGLDGKENLTQKTYLKLTSDSIMKYTVIRDDVYLYNKPSINSGYFQGEDKYIYNVLINGLHMYTEATDTSQHYTNKLTYKVIHAGAFLYNDTNINSGLFSKNELEINGHFTGSEIKGSWIKHVNGGWTPISFYGITYLEKTTFDDDKGVILNKDGVYTGDKIVDNNWVHHINGGYAPIYLNGTECMKKSTTGSPLFKGGEFTAKEKNGNWVQHINGGWSPIVLNGVMYLQPGYDSGIDNTENAKDTGITSTDESDGLLKTNNHITQTIQNEIGRGVNTLQEYIKQIQIWNKNSVVKRYEVASGFADLEDRLTDEWLPRLVYIYFEDRVYLGHFTTFNYSRQATTENITYNMAFVIHRTVSVTSIDPTRFEQQVNIDLRNANNNKDASMAWQDSLDYFEKQCSLGNDIPIKLAILRARCYYYMEERIADYTGVPMTEDRKAQLSNWVAELREKAIYNGEQIIKSDTPIYGNTELNYKHCLYFIQLQYIKISEDKEYTTDSGVETKVAVQAAQEFLNLTTRINGALVDTTEIQTSDNLALMDDYITSELARVNNVWTTEAKNGYKNSPKESIYDYANSLMYSIGARYNNNYDWQTIYGYWKWQHDQNVAIKEANKTNEGKTRLPIIDDRIIDNNRNYDVITDIYAEGLKDGINYSISVDSNDHSKIDFSQYYLTRNKEDKDRAKLYISYIILKSGTSTITYNLVDANDKTKIYDTRQFDIHFNEDSWNEKE